MHSSSSLEVKRQIFIYFCKHNSKLLEEDFKAPSKPSGLSKRRQKIKKLKSQIQRRMPERTEEPLSCTKSKAIDSP